MASHSHDIRRLLGPGQGNILVLTNDFPPQHGGIQTFVRQICADLPPDRVVVHAPRHPHAEAYDRTLPFPVVRDPARVLLPSPALARRVQATILRHGITQVLYGASVPLGLLAGRVRSVGVSWQIALTHGHEVWWAALPGTRQALQRVARDVDVMTYVSDYTRGRLAAAVDGHSRRFLRLTPRAGDHFHDGWDGTEVRRTLGIPEQSLVVVCVARLVRRKGQDRLIRIWPEVVRRFPGAHLLLVGDGPDRSRLWRMVERRGLGSCVHVTGEVAMTPPYYAAADVFAMPVRNRYFGLEVEALGISYLEAAAMGLTVVPGRGGGSPEAWTDANRPPS